MEKDIQRANILYSLIQACYWMSYAIAGAFAGVYLLGHGYSNSMVGLVIAAGNIAGFLMNSLFADWIDHYEKVTPYKVANGTIILNALFLAGALFLSGKVVNAICWMGNIACCGGTAGAVLKISIDFDHRGLPVNFGLSRAVGSIGYTLVTIIIGPAVENNSLNILPVAGLIILFARIILNAVTVTQLPEKRYIPVIKNENPTISLSLFGFIREYKCFMLFIVGCSVVFVSHNFFNSFLINCVNNVGGNVADMGMLASYVALLEVPVMAFFNRFFRKKRIVNIIIFSIAMFPVKALSISLAPNMGWLYGVLILQMFSFALFTPASVAYVDEVIPFKDSAKAQSLCFGATTIGTVVAAFIGGKLYDACSVRLVLFIGFIISLFGAAIAVAGVKLNKEK